MGYPRKDLINDTSYLLVKCDKDSCTYELIYLLGRKIIADTISCNGFLM